MNLKVMDQEDALEFKPRGRAHLKVADSERVFLKLLE